MKPEDYFFLRSSLACSFLYLMICLFSWTNLFLALLMALLRWALCSSKLALVIRALLMVLLAWRVTNLMRHYLFLA